MTPLLPRAPISDPWLMASHVAASSSGADSISATTASSVRAMFVPVSPSGTGYTLSRLMPASCARMQVAERRHRAAQLGDPETFERTLQR